MKFKIQLINVGRDDICQEYEQEAENLNEMANLVYHKCNHFLLSLNTCLEPDSDDEETWNLFAGFRLVGKVKIKEIKE